MLCGDVLARWVSPDFVRLHLRVRTVNTELCLDSGIYLFNVRVMSVPHSLGRLGVVGCHAYRYHQMRHSWCASSLTGYGFA